MSADLTGSIARWAAAATVEDVPPLAARNSARSVADTFAVIAAASVTPGAVQRVLDFAQRFSRGPQALLLGRDQRVCTEMAAWAHGALAHYLDFDDVEYVSVYHPSGSVVPVAVALAEADPSITGADLLLAIAMGQDFGTRLARAIPLRRDPPWHRSVLVGTFASALAAARLMRIDAQGIEAALGHALNQAAGSLKLRWDEGSEAGSLYAGYAARAGITAAYLAQGQIPAVRGALDGETGLFELYYRTGPDHAALLDGLGQRWMSDELAIKPWPACAATNTYTAAMLHLRRNHKLQPEDISAIELRAGDYALRNCLPIEQRRRPPTEIDAKFSAPWCAAVAAVSGRLVSADFTPEALRNPAYLAMAEKVTIREDATLNITSGIPPGEIRLTTLNGEVLTARVDLPYGHPDLPVSDEVFVDKIKGCLRIYRPAAQGLAADFLDDCQALPELARGSDVLRALRRV